MSILDIRPSLLLNQPDTIFNRSVMFQPDIDLTSKLLEITRKTRPEGFASALSAETVTLDDFAALISSGITNNQVKQLAEASYRLTRKRFGFALSLYAPLYYDNRCVNGCTYCGFNAKNNIARRKLSRDEILLESAELRKRGFQNILLVAGEHPESSDIELLAVIIKDLHNQGFSCVSIEIAPLDTDKYLHLVDKSHLDGLYIYQETYNREIYDKSHLYGKKKDYDFRIETPERGAKAGIAKIGIGFLLGLNNWREDAINLAQHLLWLQKNHWQTEYSISFPRIRCATGIQAPATAVSDRDFINLVCALRLLFPETGMSLSTREFNEFRDNVIPLGFTSLSAGSSTAPGGYTSSSADLEQFEVEDNRTAAEISAMLKNKGFEPVWKDWV